MENYEKRPYLKSDTSSLLEEIQGFLVFQNKKEETEVDLGKFTNSNGQVTHDRVIRVALRNLKKEILPGAEGN